SEVSGLLPGAKVVLSGIKVGVVEEVEFDRQSKDIRVTLSILNSYREWIRSSATAEIVTQGVLGDKYVALEGGDLKDPELPEGSRISARLGNDLSQFLSKGDALMASLKKIAG